MKNLLYILFISVLCGSCSSDKDNENNKGLKGSVWYSNINGQSELIFKSDSECHLSMEYHNLTENDDFDYKDMDSFIELYHKDNNIEIVYKLEFNKKGNLSLYNSLGYYIVELTPKK